MVMCAPALNVSLSCAQVLTIYATSSSMCNIMLQTKSSCSHCLASSTETICATSSSMCNIMLQTKRSCSHCLASSTEPASRCRYNALTKAAEFVTQSKGEIYIGVIGKRATFWPGLPWWPMGEDTFDANVRCHTRSSPVCQRMQSAAHHFFKRWAVAPVTGRWRLPAQDFTELSQSMKATARLLFALHLAFDEVRGTRASLLCNKRLTGLAEQRVAASCVNPEGPQAYLLQLLQGFDEDLLAMLRQQYPGAHARVHKARRYCKHSTCSHAVEQGR
jgi:hypothetical protein